MSKKLWQELISQNMVTISQLTAVTDEMGEVNGRLDYPKWSELNHLRAALIDDLNTELTAAYFAQPVKSVARQGKDSFWREVNRLVNGG